MPSSASSASAAVEREAIARFGADIALPDLLMELAQCERRRNFSRPCGARFHGPQVAAQLGQSATTLLL
jgi:hypothetical protein